MRFGEPLPVRERRIRELIANPTARTWPFEFKGRIDNYPIYQVSLEFPKYRLNNGRTLAAQEEWIATHPGTDSEFFSRDQELDSAQKAQHEILTNMVDEENLLKYFKENPQKEPLVLSNRGFVINGNRRLCAFRILYGQDSSKFRNFAQVDVIILPPTDERDIYELEVNLQVLPDLKAEYNWLREAKMLKRGREQFNYNDNDLARIYHCKQREVREKIQLLEYADAYLAERGWPNQYHRVEKAEFAFRRLRDGKSELKSESDKDIFEKLSYMLLDNPGGKGRLYEAIPEVQAHFDKILDRIKKAVPVSLPQSSGTSDLDLLGPPDDALVALAKAISSPSNRDRVMDAMIDVLQAEREKTREFRTTNYSLRRTQEANTALLEALTNLNGASNTDGLVSQLDSIESTLGKIRLWLKTNAESSIPR